MIKVFSKRLKQLRKENGYTQTHLASILGVARTCISNWESGTRVPDSEMIAKIAVVFHVNADYLLGAANTSSTEALIKQKMDFSKLNDVRLQKLFDYYTFLVIEQEHTA